MPAIAELNRHAAAFLPLPVCRTSHDLPIDHNHCGQADEFLLLAEFGDQTRERGARRAVASRSPIIAGIEYPACQSDERERRQQEHD